jgi:hypothetical protein
LKFEESKQLDIILHFRFQPSQIKADGIREAIETRTAFDYLM